MSRESSMIPKVRTLSLAHDREIYMGLDVGGTHLRLMLYNAKEQVFYPLVKTRWHPGDDAGTEVERNLCGLIEVSLKHYDIEISKVQGIGLALAANFDRKTGAITRWPNRPLWNGFPLAEYLRERYSDIPCISFEDDANAAALGEYLTWQRHHDTANALYLTIGTGVGGGLILNGALHTGQHGLAGEIGHVVVRPEGPLCVCGRRGCLQALVSGPALLRTIASRYPQLEHGLNLTETIRLAEQSGCDIREIFQEAGDVLGDFLATLIQTLDISLIIAGGGVLHSMDNTLLDAAKRRVASFFHGSNRNLMIVKSEWEDVNGLLGALSLHCSDQLSADLLNNQKQVMYSEQAVL